MDARARSPAADFENHIIVGDNGRRKGNNIATTKEESCMVYGDGDELSQKERRE
jgi:hypothetical protein